MAAKLTTVKPPKYNNWPITGLVQLGPLVGDFHPTQELFLDGEAVGKIVTIENCTPHRNIKGTRLRRDLKTRKAWKYQTGPGHDSRIAYDTRNDAIAGALRDHVAKLERENES